MVQLGCNDLSETGVSRQKETNKSNFQETKWNHHESSSSSSPSSSSTWKSSTWKSSTSTIHNPHQIFILFAQGHGLSSRLQSLWAGWRNDCGAQLACLENRQSNSWQNRHLLQYGIYGTYGVYIYDMYAFIYIYIYICVWCIYIYIKMGWHIWDGISVAFLGQNKFVVCVYWRRHQFFLRIWHLTQFKLLVLSWKPRGSHMD